MNRRFLLALPLALPVAALPAVAEPIVKRWLPYADARLGSIEQKICDAITRQSESPYTFWLGSAA